MTTTNAARHAAALAYVSATLDGLGLAYEVQQAQRTHGLTYRVWPRLGSPSRTLAVRATTARWQWRHVTTGQRCYSYRRLAWSWGLHSHGKRIVAPDFFVLVMLDRLAESLVVPAHVVGPAKSVSLLADVAAPSSVLRQYAGRWDLCTAGARRRAA